MKDILIKIDEKFSGIKPYSFLVEPMLEDINDPQFLGKLCNSAYLAYLHGDLDFTEEILELFINIPFDGNYDKWTSIEYGINLKMFISIRRNDMIKYNSLKQIIYSKFDYAGLPESTRRINLKAFTRRISGNSLEAAKEKANDQNKKKNTEIEFMYLVAYYSDLVFVYSLNEGNVEESINNELEYTQNRILEIIDYYKSNS